MERRLLFIAIYKDTTHEPPQGSRDQAGPRPPQLLAAKKLAGLALKTRPNFAWITGGGQNAVSLATEIGAASILVTKNRAILVSNNIEARRLQEEHLDGLDLETAEFPWHQEGGEAATIAKLTGGKPYATDTGTGGTLNLDGSVPALHYPFVESEVVRYMALGDMAGRELEVFCRSLEPGMTEFDVAAADL